MPWETKHSSGYHKVCFRKGTVGNILWHNITGAAFIIHMAIRSMYISDSSRFEKEKIIVQHGKATNDCRHRNDEIHMTVDVIGER
jgi:hypothetical protein